MSATARLTPKQQTLAESYAPPANFLEIDVCDPQTHGIGNKRYTDYEVRLKVGEFKFLVLCQRFSNSFFQLEIMLYKNFSIS